MLEYLKAESNLTRTENGAATCRTTGSECLDLFASIGALRHAEDGDVLTGSVGNSTVNVASGATVTFSDVFISNNMNRRCINCLGSATIILSDGTTKAL